MILISFSSYNFSQRLIRILITKLYSEVIIRIRNLIKLVCSSNYFYHSFSYFNNGYFHLHFFLIWLRGYLFVAASGSTKMNKKYFNNW